MNVMLKVSSVTDPLLCSTERTFSANSHKALHNCNGRVISQTGHYYPLQNTVKRTFF